MNYELPPAWRGSRYLILMVLFLPLITLSGCAERQLVTVTPQMDIEPQFWIRVLLHGGAKVVSVQVDSAFEVLDGEMNYRLAAFDRLYGPLNISVSGGRITFAGRNFGARRIVIFPDEPYIFSINGSSYRGKLELILNSDGKSFDAVNLVPLEPYLAGVVGAEMPSYWEAAALQSQAIAARTYCMYVKRQFGSKRNYDVSRTQSNQVYRGLAAESSRVWEAVNKTWGQVLECRQVAGKMDIFPAYYSSTCGGHTENSRNVFGDSFESLVGVKCSYCKYVAKATFFFWPKQEFDTETVTAKLSGKYPKLKRLGDIVGIVGVEQSDYGKFSRLTKIKIVGSTGKSDFLRAEDLRLSLDSTGRKLKSTICKIVKSGDKWVFLSGRGWGHGVGMCQCGAEGMARQGYRANQILSHYYPRSQIVKLY